MPALPPNIKSDNAALLKAHLTNIRHWMVGNTKLGGGEG